MEASEDLDRLRQDVRAWVAVNKPAGWPDAYVGASTAAFLDMQRAWFATLVAAGYATPHWDARWPGGGRSLRAQVTIFEELARAGAPRPLLHFLSLYHAAVTIEKWGTPGQIAEHLPRILEGTVWCQGFSEPGAGSDLASLRTAAVRDGDHYVVNGQKIWSTMGHHAEWCLLLVRTSSEGAKQAGITYLLMDMTSPGVTVRPIKQMTGDEEFAEIFLTDVRVPVANRLGAEGQGWTIAQTTLSAERGLTLVEFTERLNLSAWRLIDAMGARGQADCEWRRAAVDVLVKIKALKALIARNMERRVAGDERVGDSSTLKLFYTETLRDFVSLGEQARELAGQAWSPLLLGAGQETGNWMFDLLNSFQWSIAGGSSEIQRGIVAQRVLNLPMIRPERRP